MARRALLPLLLALACSRSPQPAPEPARTAAGVPAAAPQVAPAAPAPAPAPPPEVAVKEAVEVPPGAPTTASPLAVDAETVVDPGSTFRVVLAGSCRDARLMLLDASGAAVPAAETAEIGITTTLVVSPAAALTPGSRYQLRLDGATGRELHLGDRAYPPVRYALRAAGEQPPPAPKAPPRRRGKRR